MPLGYFDQCLCLRLVMVSVSQGVDVTYLIPGGHRWFINFCVLDLAFIFCACVCVVNSVAVKFCVPKGIPTVRCLCFYY